MTVSLRVTSDRLEKNKVTGTIWGDVWIELCDFAFPEENWNDMVVAVLIAFCDEIRKLPKCGHFAKFDVSFMDGPLEVVFSYHDDVNVRLDFLRSGKPVKPSAIVKRAELVSAVVVGAANLLAIFESKGWGPDDQVDRLQKRYQAAIEQLESYGLMD